MTTLELRSSHQLLSLLITEPLVLPSTSLFKIEFDPSEIEPVMVHPNLVGALILTGRHDGGHAQSTVFVESSNKSELAFLQWTLICLILSLLKRLKQTIDKIRINK